MLAAFQAGYSVARKQKISAITQMPIVWNGSVLAGSSVRKRICGSQIFWPVTSPMNFTTASRKVMKRKPSTPPAATPSAPIVVPTVTKMRISPPRVAPIVRNTAMSRVLARTSMISDETMLKAATTRMIDRIVKETVRSTASASNSSEFIIRQSVIWPTPLTLSFSGWRICATRSGSTVSSSIIETPSPSSSSVCASSIGMTAKTLS